MLKFLLIFLLPFYCYLVGQDAMPQKGMAITPSDLELISFARETIKVITVPEKHFVLAAIRTTKGEIYTGFNFKTIATRASVCAESIALAKVIEAKDTPETLVVVANLDGKQEPVIVTPCGICRELLYDYAPEAHLIIIHEGSLIKIPTTDLLIFPYKR